MVEVMISHALFQYIIMIYDCLNFCLVGQKKRKFRNDRCSCRIRIVTSIRYNVPLCLIVQSRALSFLLLCCFFLQCAWFFHVCYQNVSSLVNKMCVSTRGLAVFFFFLLSAFFCVNLSCLMYLQPFQFSSCMSNLDMLVAYGSNELSSIELLCKPGCMSLMSSSCNLLNLILFFYTISCVIGLEPMSGCYVLNGFCSLFLVIY